MKLVRYGEKGAEKPGLIDKSGQLRDLSAHLKDLTGEAYAPESLRKLAGLDSASLPAVSGKPRLGAPVTGISKFVAIGLNYTDHAKETGNPIPSEPIFFLKANTALSGPNDPVEKPRGSTKLDWEVEIAAIIGTRAKYVSEADALNHVAGYCICNDVSERNFQIDRPGQWTRGKSHDTFGPLGPWVLTKDEVPDVQNLSMWLDVNGQRRQTGSTKTMIFSIAKCVSYLSQFLTLLPGDIITTGTPPGVGSGMKPPTFLNVGDVVTLGIEGLGEQRQEIVAA
ncbi:fumarylacetoacetate hydrolase family protein [Bradyrhizobium sp. ISRA443]|uniref:fumarylacetoacetate hydrolase family protein n=1 Tax=unclassified Bradyrhizobium TaxID=2631580 RepID=UPI00247A012F|nr:MULTISPECIES: fumarylacetoacetate hydrolase family protein [unclassified Bradyrhizobium]WGR95166.1 fumarylacetoacetate hydrolase family protein [Bradyrhizobium sp. ISRA435]WGS00088.1 fumarylacetoacetate hydrolase family protein [Bradyrhizobium sp. ISRA436]WGS06977.1 fumarylacetoacetate hydrolase family protein [Bradyrhizobium sp. ISRA437]WGS13859.1 fumarylacetoacetate hydrolase family protein [Bradyrhizobium sp. ISRA443]